MKGVQLKESKIGVGDNVSINQMGDPSKEEKLTKSKKLISGIVYKKTEHKVVVSVDAGEDTPTYLEDQIVAVLMEVSNVTYRRMQNVLKDLEKAAQDSGHPTNHLIHVLFSGLDPHEINRKVQQKHVLRSDEELAFNNPGLNQEQKRAVRLALETQSFAMSN